MLTILFIGLKLTNHINWDWLWVLSPLWIPIACLLGTAAVLFLLGGIALLIHKAREARRKAREVREVREVREIREVRKARRGRK